MANIFASRQPYNVGDAISTGFVYEPKPGAVDGRAIRQNVPPYNGATFTPGSTLMFNIPTSRPNHFLNGRMTYIKFTINNTDAETAAPDYIADSVFQSLTLYHGSNQLENRREYGVWSMVERDMFPTANKQRVYQGQHAATARTGISITASGGTLVVCMPLLSGLVGKSAPKYLPTFAMTGGDLRLEMELASTANGLFHDTAETDWTLSNVELILEYGELTPSATAAIMQAYPDFVFSFDTIEQSAQTLTAGATSYQILIPARYSRLKALYSTFRKTANIGTALAKSVSQRMAPPNMTSWYYSVGGVHFPPTPVGGYIETAAEVVKTFHGLGDEEDWNLNLAQWATTTYSASADYGFLVAQDMEWLTQKSDSAISGIDTKTLDSYLIMSFSSAFSSNLSVDNFAQFDATGYVRNGTFDIRR